MYIWYYCSKIAKWCFCKSVLHDCEQKHPSVLCYFLCIFILQTSCVHSNHPKYSNASGNRSAINFIHFCYIFSVTMHLDLKYQYRYMRNQKNFNINSNTITYRIVSCDRNSSKWISNFLLSLFLWPVLIVKWVNAIFYHTTITRKLFLFFIEFVR